MLACTRNLFISLGIFTLSIFISAEAFADAQCRQVAANFLYRNTLESRLVAKERARHFCSSGGDAHCLQETAAWLRNETNLPRHEIAEEALARCQDSLVYPEDSVGVDGSIGHAPPGVTLPPKPPAQPPPPPVKPQPKPQPVQPPPPSVNSIACAGSYGLVHYQAGGDFYTNVSVEIRSDSAGNLTAKLSISDGRVLTLTGVCQAQSLHKGTAHLNYQGHPQYITFDGQSATGVLPGLGMTVLVGAKQ